MIQDHGVTRSLGADIALDVMTAERSKIDPQMPRLINAFTLALYDIVPNHSDTHSAADKKAIHDRLMQVASVRWARD